VQGAVVEFRMYKAELIQRTQRRIEENRTQNRIAQALEKPRNGGGDGYNLYVFPVSRNRGYCKRFRELIFLMI